MRVNVSNLPIRALILKPKFVLLDMARAWLALAEQGVKNSQTTLVYETPTPGQHPAQQQQQQQLEPDES
jgi:hypothetical protein